MLDIQIKECCMNCNHADIDHITMMSRNAMERKPENYTRIFCKHSLVCKAYLESETLWQENPT